MTQLAYPLKISVSCSVVSDSWPPAGLYPARLLCLWDSPGKNTGVGCHFLLEGILPTQGSDPADSLPSEPPGKPSWLAKASPKGQSLHNYHMSCCSASKSCPALWDPLHCSTPVFTVQYKMVPNGSGVKNLPAMHEVQVRSLGQKSPLEEEVATHSSILAWRIPWAEETGGLQSTRVGYD